MPNQGQGATKACLRDSGLTKETQALLDEVLKKRGISHRAAKDIAASVKGGNAQWVETLNRGTAKPVEAKSKHAGVQLPTYHKKAPPTLPTSFSGKRMLSQIPTPEREQWRGGPPAPDRELVKERCAKIMEKGSASALREYEQILEAAERAAAAAARARRRQDADPKEALIDQLVQEVQERTEWLESMQKAGQGSRYEAQIKQEIQTRLLMLKQKGVCA